jgi:two-component system response regulator FixJ
VFVIDDDSAALDSLLMLLEAEGMSAQGFSSGTQFLSAFNPALRGCIVTDVRMPGMDGVQLIQKLKSNDCALPIIVVTGHADVALAVQAMKAGAAEFVEKPFESELILKLIRSCLDDNDDAVDADAGRYRVRHRIDALTTRERQVLDCVVQGASNKVIAVRLGISPRTVEIYRANVMSKMQAENLSELVRMTLVAGVA